MKNVNDELQRKLIEVSDASKLNKLKYENVKSINEKSIVEKTIKNLKRMLESESRSRDNVEKAVSNAKMQVERIKLQVKCLE